MVKLRYLVVAGALAFEALVSAQGGDVDRILADTRKALGGDKLAALKSLTVTGKQARTTQRGTSESEFELALELPDKYVRRDMVASLGNMSVYRMSGFNGDGLINEMDAPPQLGGGGGTVVVRGGGSGGSGMYFSTGGSGAPGGAAKETPEQAEAQRRAQLLSNKQAFAKMALGLFGQVPAAYPMTATYVGQAEAPEGKADVIEFKDEGNFTARLFISTDTHLPLMLSWNALEPMQTSGFSTGSGNTVTLGGGGAGVASGQAPATKETRTVTRTPEGSTTRTETTTSGKPLSPEEQEKLAQKLQQQIAEAQAKRKMVEYRLYYSDFESVGGVNLPHRLQLSIDGKPSEETTFEKVKVNPKIDAKKFAVTKQ